MSLGKSNQQNGLVISYQKSGVKIAEIFFRSEAVPRDADIVRYHNFSSPVAGTHSYRYPTLQIDLQPEPDAIFGQMRRRARRKLKAAESAELTYEWSYPADQPWTDEFIEFFNRFAPLKRLPEANSSRINALRNHGMLYLSRVRDASGAVLVWHAYYFTNGVARLFHSASLFRASADREHADRVADANAFLHWRDMLQARELGCELYDWGGWHDGTDAENLRINEFKEGFGGTVVPQYFTDDGRTIKGYLAIRARQLQGKLRGNR